MRYVLETPEQRVECAYRVKINEQQTRKLRDMVWEKREKLLRVFMKYRSEDLENAEVGGENVSSAVDVVDQLMVHHITNRVFGTVDPPKYKKYITGEFRKIIQENLGSYAVSSEGEAIAQGFITMMRNPALVRRLIRRSPEMKGFFKDLIDDLSYTISRIDKERTWETWDKLWADVKEVNMSFPSVDELGGCIPRDIIVKRRIVLASKREGGRILIVEREPVGVWKEVYSLLVRRKRIRRAMEKIAWYLEGPAIFASKEFADEDIQW